MKIELNVDAYHVEILFNGLTHLKLYRRELFAIHAWEETGVYFIEWHTAKGNVITEYDRIDKWKEILKLVNEKVNLV